MALGPFSQEVMKSLAEAESDKWLCQIWPLIVSPLNGLEGLVLKAVRPTRFGLTWSAILPNVREHKSIERLERLGYQLSQHRQHQQHQQYQRHQPQRLASRRQNVLPRYSPLATAQLAPLTAGKVLFY